MKKSFTLLMLVGFLATQAYAATPLKHRPKSPQANLEQQLAKFISYPDVLKATKSSGIVVIQFRVDENNKLCQLEVFSQNKQLDNTLLRQLTGKKLKGYGGDWGELYTVRLHFQPE